MAENEKPEVSQLSYGEVNAELDALKGNDPETLARQAELFDALMTMDMGMGGFRRAMGKSAKPESTNE
jgi:hypothetical protein